MKAGTKAALVACVVSLGVGYGLGHSDVETRTVVKTYTHEVEVEKPVVKVVQAELPAECIEVIKKISTLNEDIDKLGDLAADNIFAAAQAHKAVATEQYNEAAEWREKLSDVKAEMDDSVLAHKQRVRDLETGASACPLG